MSYSGEAGRPHLAAPQSKSSFSPIEDHITHSERTPALGAEAGCGAVVNEAYRLVYEPQFVEINVSAVQT
jgi:hypothetical protein